MRPAVGAGQALPVEAALAPQRAKGANTARGAAGPVLSVAGRIGRAARRQQENRVQITPERARLSFLGRPLTGQIRRARHPGLVVVARPAEGSMRSPLDGRIGPAIRDMSVQRASLGRAAKRTVWPEARRAGAGASPAAMSAAKPPSGQARRRRTVARPSNPAASSAAVVGSGTAVTWDRLAAAPKVPLEPT